MDRSWRALSCENDGVETENRNVHRGVSPFPILRALDERSDFFTLKLRYEGETLVESKFG